MGNGQRRVRNVGGSGHWSRPTLVARNAAGVDTPFATYDLTRTPCPAA